MVTYKEYAPCDKKAPFLALGHFYAVLLVEAFNKVIFIIYTPIIHPLYTYQVYGAAAIMQ